MAEPRHTVCRKGAAVRLYGYAPAVVRVVYRDNGVLWAACRITGRGPGWKAGRIGPHGFRTGEVVYVPAADAVPRDRIYTRAGRICWHDFTIEPTGEKVRPEETNP